MFPFHQGRFQGRGLCAVRGISCWFPFHQGRFQGSPFRSRSRVRARSFHSTKEGFKAPGRPRICRAWTKVSIPPRKVSRHYPLSPELSGDMRFHSTKEGFKACSARCDRTCRKIVSIPPRKVSRVAAKAKDRIGRHRFPFHQGRFQGVKEYCPFQKPSYVSIPPRKVSRDAKGCYLPTIGNRFHSTKEGFKGDAGERHQQRADEFPFHQGRFQGRLDLNGIVGLNEFPFHQGRFQGANAGRARRDRPEVSIPPRKVSRWHDTGAAAIKAVRFHSTKEGFKGGVLFCGGVNRLAFPFHQGRFQGTSPS